MDVASEFRYRNPVIDERDLVIGITQSGETPDTLAAMRLAREKGAKVHGRHQHHGQPGHPRRRRRAVHPRGPRDRRRRHQDLRVPGGGHVPVRAEAGRGARHARDGAPRRAGRELRDLSHKVEELLATVDEPVKRMAEHWKDAGFFLYLGRHVGPGRGAGGRAEAEGDLLRAHRRLRGGRDEARPDRAAGRAHAGGVCRPPSSPVLDKVLSNISEVTVARRARAGRGHRGHRPRSPSTPRRWSTCPAPTGCSSPCWP